MQHYINNSNQHKVLDGYWKGNRVMCLWTSYPSFIKPPDFYKWCCYIVWSYLSLGLFWGWINTIVCISVSFSFYTCFFFLLFSLCASGFQQSQLFFCVVFALFVATDFHSKNFWCSSFSEAFYSWHPLFFYVHKHLLCGVTQSARWHPIVTVPQSQEQHKHYSSIVTVCVNYCFLP